MARLTWDNIRAPEYDTRGLAQAGAGVSNAFDSVGKMLMDREARLREQATGNAMAELFSLGTPEEVAARLAQGGAGLDPRVNKAEFFRQGRAYEGERTQQQSAQEDLLNKQALTAFGEEHGQLAEAALNGDAAAIAAINERSSGDPLWGRFMAQTVEERMGYRDTGIDNRHATAVLGETARGHDLSHKASMASVGVQQARLNADLADRAERKAKEREAEAAILTGRSFAETLDPKFSPEDATTVLRKSDLWKAAKPHEQAAMEASLGQAYGARVATTEFDLRDRGTLQPLATGGMPAFLTPGANQGGQDRSFQGLAERAARLQAEASVGEQAQTNRFRAEKPVLAAIQLGQTEHADVKVPELTQRLATTGVNNPGQFIQRMLDTYPALTPGMIAGIMDTTDLSDQAFWSAEGSTMGNVLFGGERQLERRVQEVVNEITSGDATKSQVELDRRTAPYKEVLAQQQRVLARAQREQGSGKGISTETARQLEMLEARLEQIQPTQVERLPGLDLDPRWSGRR